MCSRARGQSHETQCWCVGLGQGSEARGFSIIVIRGRCYIRNFLGAPRLEVNNVTGNVKERGGRAASCPAVLHARAGYATGGPSSPLVPPTDSARGALHDGTVMCCHIQRARADSVASPDHKILRLSQPLSSMVSVRIPDADMPPPRSSHQREPPSMAGHWKWTRGPWSTTERWW